MNLYFPLWSETYLPAVTLGGGRRGGALVNWCGGLVDRRGIPLLGAQGAAGGASLVVLMMRHGGHRGPPSTLSPADLEHPQALSISLLSVHLKNKGQGVTAVSCHHNQLSKIEAPA